MTVVNSPGTVLLMTHTATATKFNRDERVTNDNGAWATLRFDAFGGAGCGVWYAEAWAPNFPSDVAFHELASNRDRARVERGMKQWLAGR